MKVKGDIHKCCGCDNEVPIWNVQLVSFKITDSLKITGIVNERKSRGKC